MHRATPRLRPSPPRPRLPRSARRPPRRKTGKRKTPRPRGLATGGEDKVGLLLTMTEGEAAAADPCPEIPASFLDVVRTSRSWCGSFTSTSKEGEDAVKATPWNREAAARGVGGRRRTYRPPVVQQRQVAASRQPGQCSRFAGAQAAWALGFQGGGRPSRATARRTTGRCSVASLGQFEPIVDFVHALTYVFAAAMAGRRFAAGWVVYSAVDPLGVARPGGRGHRRLGGASGRVGPAPGG